MIGEDDYNYVTKIRLYSADRAGGKGIKTFRHSDISTSRNPLDIWGIMEVGRKTIDQSVGKRREKSDGSSWI
jgi:hypothetical protein